VNAPLRNGVIGFVAALIVILGAFAYEQFVAAPSATEQGDLSLGGPFTLTDQNGAVKHDGDFRGKVMLVYFGYTYCPDVCPTTLDMITRALAKLGSKADEVAPIFVTVDPARDTSTQMKLYIGSFDPRFEALTGTPQQIQAVAGEYRVYYRKADDDGNAYTVDHSSVIYLMGRDGRYLGHFNPGIGADEMAKSLQKFL
jgi:cytochrome oxidase Cu insertion factor (SCO1/SenC/PrrC family)